jgi:hypothetical protein
VTDTPAFDRLMDARALLLDLRALLRAVLSDREQWTALSGDSTAYTPADVAIDEREARIVADAIYALWEGTPYAIRLEQAHAPWRVVLLAEGETYGVGASSAYVSGALADAIDDSLATLEAKGGKGPS